MPSYTLIKLKTSRNILQKDQNGDLKNVTGGPTDGWTGQPIDIARCRVACPRLKQGWVPY